MIKSDIVFYINDINNIGGVEQWIYYISKKYGVDHNITLVYRTTKSTEQVKRVAKNMRCIKYNNEKIECNTIFFCFHFDIINNVTSKEYIMVIHADYSASKLRIVIPPQITKLYAVSEVAKNGFISLHQNQLDKLKLKIEVLYNPVALDEPKKVLKLISATRLTPDKGRARMEQLATRLNERGILFYWLVFTNERLTSNIPNFIYMKPTLDILGYIKESDILVQLSNSEAFAYTMVESMVLGVPVAVTNFPVVEEMGIKDGVNGYVFKMSMSNIDEVIDKMISTNLKGFKYEVKHSEDEWNKLLGKKVTPDYKYNENNDIIRVRVLKPYTDTMLNRKTKKNEELEISAERYKRYKESIPGFFEVIEIRQPD